MGPDSLPSRASVPAPADGQRLTQAERLRRRQDYLAAYEHGTRVSGSLMTVFFHTNSLGHARLGIAATRKIGSAVVRNRAKRRVRDVYRRHKLSASLDVVVIPRRELATAPPERVESEFRALVKRHLRRKSIPD